MSLEINDEVYLSHAYPDDTYLYQYHMATSNIMMDHDESLGTKALSGHPSDSGLGTNHEAYHQEDLLYSHPPGYVSLILLPSEHATPKKYLECKATTAPRVKKLRGSIDIQLISRVTKREVRTRSFP